MSGTQEVIVKKPLKSKLKLNKQTLRALSPDQLDAVAGGWSLWCFTSAIKLCGGDSNGCPCTEKKAETCAAA
jgi:hypothetical protein